MRGLLRLFLLLAVMFCGGIVLIRLLYDVSWSESVEIADQFIEDLFGAEKAAKLDRTAACEAAGIRWTLHSDDPVTEMNPLRCIENAVTRTMWKSDGLLSPEERIPVEAALRAATLDAAWQCHADHEVGSLEPGKFADFIVLECDPGEVEETSISEIEVLQTWVHGECVYRA